MAVACTGVRPVVPDERELNWNPAGTVPWPADTMSKLRITPLIDELHGRRRHRRRRNRGRSVVLLNTRLVMLLR